MISCGQRRWQCVVRLCRLSGCRWLWLGGWRVAPGRDWAFTVRLIFVGWRAYSGRWAVTGRGVADIAVTAVIGHRPWRLASPAEYRGYTAPMAAPQRNTASVIETRARLCMFVVVGPNVALLLRVYRRWPTTSGCRSSRLGSPIRRHDLWDYPPASGSPGRTPADRVQHGGFTGATRAWC